MADFAKGTKVPVQRTRMEIEDLLDKHGAHSRAVGQQGMQAVILFEKDGRRVRIQMELPSPSEFRSRKRGRNHVERTQREQEAALQQSLRERWRWLLLTLKAKFVSLDGGIETFEEAFLAHIVMPNGQSVGDWLLPELAESYANQKMPPLLPSGGNHHG